MKLSILMLALHSRPWDILAKDILRQAKAFPGQVELLIESDNGERTSGQKRNAITARSTGEYLAFVDDDDAVDSGYVTSLMEGIERNVDVVTFNLQRDTEIWRFGLHEDCRREGRMAANHLCAWRRSIATKVAWCDALSYADDQSWYPAIVHSGFVKTEHHCDRVLYHYLFNRATSMTHRPDRVAFSRAYFGQGLRCFKRDDEILIEVGNSPKHENAAWVRDRKNRLSAVPLADMEHYYTMGLK